MPGSPRTVTGHCVASLGRQPDPPRNASDAEKGRSNGTVRGQRAGAGSKPGPRETSTRDADAHRPPRQRSRMALRPYLGRKGSRIESEVVRRKDGTYFRHFVACGAIPLGGVDAGSRLSIF